MKRFLQSSLFLSLSLIVALSHSAHPTLAAESSELEVGIAVREITPEIPIHLHEVLCSTPNGTELNWLARLLAF